MNLAMALVTSHFWLSGYLASPSPGTFRGPSGSNVWTEINSSRKRLVELSAPVSNTSR